MVTPFENPDSILHSSFTLPWSAFTNHTPPSDSSSKCASLSRATSTKFSTMSRISFGTAVVKAARVHARYVIEITCPSTHTCCQNLWRRVLNGTGLQKRIGEYQMLLGTCIEDVNCTARFGGNGSFKPALRYASRKRCSVHFPDRNFSGVTANLSKISLSLPVLAARTSRVLTSTGPVSPRRARGRVSTYTPFALKGHVGT